MKKSWNLGITCEKRLVNDLAFSRGEEEEEDSTHTPSKGQSNGSHPNDQTTEKPLKKKKHEKTPTAKRVSVSTKSRATKHNFGRLR